MARAPALRRHLHRGGVCRLDLYRGQQYNPKDDSKMHFANVEKVFGILMIITACAMAFAHGSNDVANAIGPLSAVASIVAAGGEIGGSSHIAWWILPLAASASSSVWPPWARR
jgi:phosphate/sulfate permease